MSLRLSLVIPAYNEEDYIGACLDSIVAQIRPVDEVIVVDNASTDNTHAIVESYADKLPLTLLTESRRGVLYARTTGFEAATGDVIGRIDADAQLVPQWSTRVMRYMTKNPELDALMGYSAIYDSPFQSVQRRQIRSGLAKLLRMQPGEAETLCGGNMAIRRTAWEAAQPYLVNRPDLHEDTDLHLAAEKAGATMWFTPTVLVWLSARRYNSSITSIKKYLNTVIRTFEAHGDTERAERFRKNLPQQWKVYGLNWLVQHNYNPETGRFRPFFLKKKQAERVLPHL